MRSFLVAGLLAVTLTGCSPLGSKTESGNFEVYYKDGATKEEADRLLAHLVKTLPGVADRRTFQLRKTADGYQLRVPVKKEFRATTG